MVTCEACGNETTKLVQVRISGSVMSVCGNCKSLGTLIDKTQGDLSYSFKKNQNENLEVISNYSSVINKELAKRGFDFHQLAKGTNIKESSLTKYLSGKIHLDVETARKIEHFLEIKLVTESSSVDINNFLNSSKEDTSLSLGDLLKKQLESKK